MFEELSEGFSADSSGVYTGCIGTIDWFALRIQRPSVTKELLNLGRYYCWKVINALNVQHRCDRQKRLLWTSPRHIGSCVDSRAFLDTDLYELLIGKMKFLENTASLMLLTQLTIWNHSCSYPTIMLDQEILRMYKTSCRVIFVFVLNVHLEN